MNNINITKTQIKNLLDFVSMNDSKPVPYCFKFVILIEKNIRLWEVDGRENTEELKVCIKSDWASAISRDGLYDYYIARDDFNSQKQLNEKVNELIELINFSVDKL